MSLHSKDYMRALCRLLTTEQEDETQVKERVVALAWEEFKRTGVCPKIFLDKPKAIWALLEKHNRLSELTTLVIEVMEGRRPHTELTQEFTKEVLERLPSEVGRGLVWRDLIGDQQLCIYFIPKEIISDLFPRLLREMPAKTQVVLKHEKEVVFDFMKAKLASGTLESRGEAFLLFNLVLKYDPDEIPVVWIEALKARNREELQSIITETQERLEPWESDDSLSFYTKLIL